MMLSVSKAIARRSAFSRARALSCSMEEEAPSSKRAKPPPRIGTHNGTFHCDEALGCFLLKLTSRFRDARIIRTRDPQILESLDAVLDVGGVYDPERFRYDHHQKGFEVTFDHEFSTKLSSAGLVYKHFGLDIVGEEMGLGVDHPDVERVYKAVYKKFVEAIDAVDNGVNQYNTEVLPKYVDNTRLSERIGRLNPDWTEVNTSEKENDRFDQAMELAGQEFVDSLQYYARSWLPARTIVAKCINKRKELEPSGQIMMLDRFCPWKEHIHELEEELKVDPSIKYVLYQDERNLQWRIQAVAVAVGKFESRRPLPAAWRGLVDKKLSEEVGVDDCVFVHSSGFIGGNLSFEGVLAMGIKALLMN